MATSPKASDRVSATEPSLVARQPTALDEAAPRHARRRALGQHGAKTPGWRLGAGTAAAAPRPEPRRIVMLVYPGICLLDTVGPLDAFAMVNLIAELSDATQVPYDLAIVAADIAPIPTSVGFAITPTCTIDELKLPVDTLLVSGGGGRIAASQDEPLLAFLRRASRLTRRLGSICTGAFPLAAAGLLEGRQATTHWARAAELQQSYPTVSVDADRIFTRDGNVYTSAGILAGVDLALALIEEDHGSRMALEVARRLVVPFRRAGGQGQFSTELKAQFTDTPALRRVQDWAAANPGADLSVEALASRAGMSPRNFARGFKQATGITPAHFVARLRLDRARALLETTSLPVKMIAARCGLGSADSMRRVFVERLGACPSDYRDRFAHA